MHFVTILNATTAFANITQMDHIRKDDKKSQGPTGLKIFFLTFPMFLDQNKLASI
jgi:hypothetical protein